MLQTKLGTSKEIIDSIRKNHEENFIQGSTVYGWYDALIELKIPYSTKLNEIIDELKKNHSDIVHIGTAIERTGDYPSFLPYTTLNKVETMLTCKYYDKSPCMAGSHEKCAEVYNE